MTPLVTYSLEISKPLPEYLFCKGGRQIDLETRSYLMGKVGASR